jgi:hypothetical protein
MAADANLSPVAVVAMPAAVRLVVLPEPEPTPQLPVVNTVPSPPDAQAESKSQVEAAMAVPPNDEIVSSPNSASRLKSKFFIIPILIMCRSNAWGYRFKLQCKF